MYEYLTSLSNIFREKLFDLIYVALREDRYNELKNATF